MLREILNKYEAFSDALIAEITYRIVDNSRIIELVLSCMNADNDYEYECIILTFTEIISFRFNENENENSTVINSAFITQDNEVIVFDFFPLIYGGNKLKENENSDLKIKCRKVNYRLLVRD